jgi:hypothetical protein
MVDPTPVDLSQACPSLAFLEQALPVVSALHYIGLVEQKPASCKFYSRDPILNLSGIFHTLTV